MGVAPAERRQPAAERSAGGPPGLGAEPARCTYAWLCREFLRRARAAPCWGGGVAAARGGSERVTGRGRCTPSSGPPLPPPAPSLEWERPGVLGCYAHLALVAWVGGWVGVLQAWATLELGKVKVREGYHRDTQPFR